MANYDAGFNGGWPNGSYIRLYVNWSNSESNNTSSVSFQLESHVFNTGSYANDDPSWYIAVNGSAIASGTYNFSTGGHEVVLGTASRTYTHDSNGNLTINVSAYFGGAGSGSNLGTATLGSTAVNLGTIARASSVDSCSNITLGNTCSVKWTPKSSSFKYKLNFSLSSWSYTTDYISPSSTSQYTYTGYTIPLTVANQLPNSTSGSMSVKLYTYNSSGGAIGSASTSAFTVTIPSSVIPTISSCSVSRVTGLNSTIDGWGLYVQGMSKATFTASASGSYSSTIQYFVISGGYSVTVNGTSLSHTTGYLNNTGSLSFSVTAVDSRGRSSSAYSLSNAVYVYPYSAPAFSSAIVQRGSSPNTTNAVLQAVWTYSTVNGNNSCACIFKYKRRVDTSYTTYSSNIANSTVTTISNILSESSSYDCKFIITDTIGNTAEITASVSTTAATMDFKGGGLGIAVGKMAEEDNLLEVDWDTQFNDDVDIGGALSTSGATSLLGGLSVKDYSAVTRNIFDLIYPVGSIYLSVNATSPGSIYGGTWVLLKDRFLLGAGDDYAAGSTGGSATNDFSDVIHYGSTSFGLQEGSGAYSDRVIVGVDSDARSSSGEGVYCPAEDLNNMPPYLVVYMWKRTA